MSIKGKNYILFVQDELDYIEQMLVEKRIADLAHVQLAGCEGENCAICMKFSTESVQSVENSVDQ